MLTVEERRILAKEQYSMPYRVGDILHHSWGYEQTNCDFYQVVQVKNHSVRLKKLTSATVLGSEGFMSDSRIPIKDRFIWKANATQALTDHGHIMPEEGLLKRVSCYVQDSGQLRYFIPTPYGFCDLWDGKPQACSWYA